MNSWVYGLHEECYSILDPRWKSYKRLSPGRWNFNIKTIKNDLKHSLFEVSFFPHSGRTLPSNEPLNKI